MTDNPPFLRGNATDPNVTEADVTRAIVRDLHRVHGMSDEEIVNHMKTVGRPVTAEEVAAAIAGL